MPCNCPQTSSIGQSKSQPAKAGSVKTAAVAKVQKHPAFMSIRYSGPTSTTVTGPVSGRQYRFNHTGVVVRVDPRDKLVMSKAPHLRQV